MKKSQAIDILTTAEQKTKEFRQQVLDIMDKLDSEHNLGTLTHERIFELDLEVILIRRKCNALLLLQAEAEIELGFNQIVFEQN